MVADFGVLFVHNEGYSIGHPNSLSILAMVLDADFWCYDGL